MSRMEDPLVVFCAERVARNIDDTMRQNGHRTWKTLPAAIRTHEDFAREIFEGSRPGLKKFRNYWFAIRQLAATYLFEVWSSFPKAP